MRSTSASLTWATTGASEQPAVIEKILSHLGMWATFAHSPPAESLAA